MENLNDGLRGYHNDRYELINDAGKTVRFSNSRRFLLQFAESLKITGCILDHVEWGEIVENFDFK